MLTILNCQSKDMKRDALVAASAIFDGLLLVAGAFLLARWSLGLIHSLRSLSLLLTLLVVVPVAAFATGLYARVAASYFFNCLDDGRRVHSIGVFVGALAVLAACLLAL